ncbi:hypothetical protein [Spiroplasma endosymbiont of Virgichneumon dumeticola]
MAIKDPILFITVEEFKNSKYFNELLLAFLSIYVIKFKNST